MVLEPWEKPDDPFALLDHRLALLLADARGLERQIDALDAKIDRLNERLAAMPSRQDLMACAWGLVLFYCAYQYFN
jgi:hypothetical protein